MILSRSRTTFFSSASSFRLQPVAHLPLPIVAGLDGERTVAQGLPAQGGEGIETPGMGRTGLIEKFESLPVQLFSGAFALLGPGAFVLAPVEPLLGLGQRRFDRPQLFSESAKKVRGSFQLALFLLQSSDLHRRGLPVDLPEIPVFFELGEGIQARLESFLLLLHDGDLRADLTQVLLQPPGLLLEGGDLGGVAPAEYVAAAIVDPVAVVLFVALARGLDLAGGSDGPGLAAKLLLVDTAGHVEAVGDLPLQPVEMGGIGLKGQLTRQRFGMQSRQSLVAPPAAHPEVDHTPLEVGAIDPGGYAGIVVIGHQQGETEIAQQPLDGPFPLPLLLAHLQQFPGEGQLLFWEVEGTAEGAAQTDLLLVDIAAPRLQARDFGLQLFMFMASLGEEDPGFVEIVLDPRLPLGRLLPKGIALPPAGDEHFLGIGRMQLEGAHQFSVASGLALAAPQFLFLLADLLGDALDPVPAVLGDGAPQLPLARLLRPPLLLQPFDYRLVPGQFLVESRQPFLQQLQLEAGKPGAQGFAAGAQLLGGLNQLAVPVAVGHQGLKHLHLPLGLENRLMGPVEIVEMLDEGGDARRDVEGLEHVVAHEIGEVSHRFERDGLLKEIEGLLVVDAEAPPEPGPVGRKAVEERRPPPRAGACAGCRCRCRSGRSRRRWRGRARRRHRSGPADPEVSFIQKTWARVTVLL